MPNCVFFSQEICHAIACPQEVMGKKTPWQYIQLNFFVVNLYSHMQGVFFPVTSWGRMIAWQISCEKNIHFCMTYIALPFTSVNISYNQL